MSFCLCGTRIFLVFRKDKTRREIGGGQARRGGNGRSMPRKPREKLRERDQNRSHARCSTPQAPVVRELQHRARQSSANGWLRGELPNDVSVDSQGILLGLVDSRPRESRRDWVPHNRPGKQGGDQPLLQLKQDVRKLDPRARTAVDGIVTAVGAAACPRCSRNVQAHRVRSVDVNAIAPGAALWPHVDARIASGTCALLVLLRAPAQGGDLRIAKQAGEEGVAWRSCGGGQHHVKYRMRDTESTALYREGEYVVMDGESYVHEVTRVTGNVERVSLAVTLLCPR